MRIESKNIIVAGVRKCGTTSVFSLLAASDQVSASRIKEPQFFACEEATVREHFQWYEDLCPDKELPYRLEASTFYFTSPRAAGLIEKYCSDPYVILVLRDPARRFFSSFQHQRKQLPCSDHRDFDGILSDLEECPEGEDIFDFEARLVEAAVDKGLVEKGFVDQTFHRRRFDAEFETTVYDPYASYKYLSESSYSTYLPLWESVFGDRLHIVFFEDLCDPQGKTIQELYDFVGLPPNTAPAALPRENQTRLPSSYLARLLLTIRRDSQLGRAFAGSAKRLGLQKIGAGFREAMLLKNSDKMTGAQRSRLVELLFKEYQYWGARNPAVLRKWSTQTSK